jgi:hypothetical protein
MKGALRMTQRETGKAKFPSIGDRYPRIPMNIESSGIMHTFGWEIDIVSYIEV